MTTPGTRWGLTAAVVAAVAGAWWYGDRAPYPYGQHRLLDIPLPYLTSSDLDVVLAPQQGERALEIGPGTGLQSLHVAPRLGPHGRLDVLDVQQEMLDHVVRLAARRGIDNIVPTRADAGELPFEDNTFDAVYLVTALGEIPEPERVLREAVRVLTPHGRLVVGEFVDRHWIPFGRLHRHADSCGLHLEFRRGRTFAYLARFRPCAGNSLSTVELKAISS